MTFLQLRQKAQAYPIFQIADVVKWFPNARKTTIRNQLSLWAKKKYVKPIRRGMYQLEEYEIADPFILAPLLYPSSYLSLETALHAHGMIPDIPFSVTSVTARKTATFHTDSYGVFSYSHVKPSLFFGFRIITTPLKYSYRLAVPEKALFDYFYLKSPGVDNPPGFVEELRLSIPEEFSFQQMTKWQKLIPTSLKRFHRILNAFFQQYA